MEVKVNVLEQFISEMNKKRYDEQSEILGEIFNETSAVLSESSIETIEFAEAFSFRWINEIEGDVDEREYKDYLLMRYSAYLDRMIKEMGYE